MADDVTPKILAAIRDDIRALDEKFSGQMVDIRTELREVRQEIAETTKQVLIVGAVVHTIDTRLQHVERWQKEASFLPRRVDKLELRTKRHGRRIARLEKKLKARDDE